MAKCRVAENRGARERRSYEVSYLVRSVSQYKKKIKTLLSKNYTNETLSVPRPCTASVPHNIYCTYLLKYVSDGQARSQHHSISRHDLDFPMVQ